MATVLFLNASMAAASEYSDFRIPSHSWSRLEVALFGAYSPSLANSQIAQQRTTDARGTFSGSWSHGHDSDRLEHRVELFGAASGSDQTQEFDRTDPPPYSHHEQTDNENRVVNEDWRLFGEIRLYPLSAPLGIMARVLGQGGYTQSWTSDNRLGQDLLTGRAQAHELDTESWLYSHDVSASVGLPWGRVRDVTGVQRVQYVEERLLRGRVLTDRLDPRTRQRLAELFYAETKFSFVHDLPDRYFWAEFERILREDPAVRVDRLDAYALYRAADPLIVSRGFGRRAGYSVGPVITFVHENDVRRDDFHYHDRSFQDDTLQAESEYHYNSHRGKDGQQARAGAEAEIEQPLGLRWHLSALGAATSDLRGIDQDLRVQSFLAFRFWEGEHWYWDTGVTQERHTGTELSKSEIAWQVAYWSNLSYYLEDHVSIDLGLKGSQLKYENEEYRRGAEFRIGVSYRTGSLTAPGLFAPVRAAS